MYHYRFNLQFSLCHIIGNNLHALELTTVIEVNEGHLLLNTTRSDPALDGNIFKYILRAIIIAQHAICALFGLGLGTLLGFIENLKIHMRDRGSGVRSKSP